VRRRLLPILATLAGAGLVGLLVYGVTARSASRTLDERVAHDERPAAPDATRALPLLDGRGAGTLAAYRGKVVVLNFWASPDSQSFVRHYRLTYPNLRDNNGTFSHSYGTDQLPESFVIDRRGRIAAISRGEINQAFLDRAIALAQST
jgi:cytochrome c biogenesis protein CcmG/thiol:disulfide interchange protein DsbE